MLMQNLLIVEDDDALAKGVQMNLELAGYGAMIARNLAQAERCLSQQSFELVILDINLPDGDGLSFSKRIKSGRDIPIVFLTAKDLDEDMIVGFQAGADDYITKPFNVQILLQRVKAVLRRYSVAETSENQLQTGNLLIDFDAHTVLKKAQPLSLTPTEFKLLKKFSQNLGIVLSRQVLLEQFWDSDENYVDEHTLTIFISRLRSKIADEEFTYIKTIYGIGYRWIGEE